MLILLFAGDVQGKGHYANECPTVMRRRQMNYNTTLSDESDMENTDDHVVLIATVEDDSMSNNSGQLDVSTNVD